MRDERFLEVTRDFGLFPAKSNLSGRRRTRRLLTVYLAALGLLLALLSPAAAADGVLDPSFITGPGPYAGVQTIPEIKGNYGYPTVTGSPYNNSQLFFGNFYGITNSPNPMRNYNSICRWTNSTLDTTFVQAQIYGEIRGAYIYPHNDPTPALQDKILIWGSFNAFSGSSQYANFARLNVDGSLDITFPHTISWGGAVNSVALQGAGPTAKILVGGYNLNTNNGDGPSYQLVRLDYQGNLDGSYTPWGAPNGYVTGFRVYASDPVFGNDVRVYCTYPKNPDGSGGYYYMLLVDANAAPPSITTPVAFIGDETVDGPIFNLAKENISGKWLICGQFKNVNNGSGTWLPRNRVARLGTDAKTLDLSYDVGVGPNGPVTQINPQMTNSPYDDRMVLGGNFDTWNGTSCGYLVRLTTSGAVDSSFNTGGTGADDRVWRLTWNANGSGGMVYGYFRSFNGQPRGGIAGLDGNGNLLSMYSTFSAVAGGSGMVYSMATQSDGKIIIGGDFNGVGGKYRTGLARLNPDGSLDTSFKGGVDGIVKSVAVQADGKILVGGQFGQIQAFSRPGLARVNPNSYLDTAFDPKVVNFGNSVPNIHQVLPLSNGQMMLAGELWNANGDFPAARLNNDGTVDSSFNSSSFSIPGAGWYWTSRVAVAGNNYVIAGGWDTDTLGGGGFLARLTNSGALDTGFYPVSNTHIQNLDGEVDDLLVQPDGKIVVSGTFSHIIDGSGNPARYAIARFSAGGLLDTTFIPSPALIPPPGSSISINAMARQTNGKLLIEANLFNGPINNNNNNYLATLVARLNADGSLDPSFTVGAVGATSGWFYNGGGNSILRLPGGKALIGGIFNTYNGAPAWSLVRIYAGAPGFTAADYLLLLDN